MIPVSTLYDEYIDRPKLSEQEKPFEYIVPPPPPPRNNKARAVGTIKPINGFILNDRWIKFKNDE